MYRKGMVLAIICLFLGAGVVPSISGNIEGLKDNLNFDNDSPLNRDEVHVTYSFQKPTIKTVDIAGTIYNRVISPGLDPAGDSGEPLIPSKGAYILLPSNSKAIDVTVNPAGMRTIESEFIVEPMEKSKTLSEQSNFQPPTPNENIYDSNTFYPGNFFTKVGTYYFRGYQILVLLLHPIQYNPVTGEIDYYQQLDVSIKTTSFQKTSSLFRGLERDAKEVQSKVDNPEDIKLYQQIHPQSSQINDGYDLLIITTIGLKGSFQQLKEDHDNREILTEIRTLSDIGGSGSPEDIRDFIKSEYTSNGVEYVLLGGDADVVPAKMIYVKCMDEERWKRTKTMPVDLYYACLDGGGPGSTEDDLLAEVYVGRACVGDSSEVNKFCKKTITYMDKKRGTDSYLDKVCLAGEYLSDCGIASFAGNELDQLIDECSDDGYTTIGIPSDDYTINKLYDRDWSGFDPNDPYETGWQPQDIIHQMNSGLHIIKHNGHSWYNYNMKMSYEWIKQNYIHNDNKPFFAYSSGCMAGGFDDPEGYDCFAEYSTAKSYAGAFAGIWNARYGFYWTFRLDSDSNRYAREFFDAVFGENIYNIGKANHDSKEDNLHLIDRSCMRWVYYGTNLFGDPAVTFHINYPPDKPETPAGLTRGKAGEEYTYSTSSAEPDGEQIYYKWSWGEGNYSGWLGPFNSGETCEASYTWIEQNNYNITVKAKDVHGEESDWSDPLPISMPKNKAINSPLLRFLENHPYMFPLLRQLLSCIIYEED